MPNPEPFTVHGHCWVFPRLPWKLRTGLRLVMSGPPPLIAIRYADGAIRIRPLIYGADFEGGIIGGT